MLNRINRGIPINPNFKILAAIKQKGLMFVSTQPDNTYFHWQVEVYMFQFNKFGITDNCHVLFAYSGDGPSEGALRLQKMYKNVYFYKDEREDKGYIPAIRPHLLSKFFKEYPHLAKNFFYHDADIIFTKLPDFSLMLKNNISYLSDTVSYIGYNYIMDCCKRYKDVHKELPDDDLFVGMCKTVNIDPRLVIANQKNSGGAQLLLKNTNWEFWENCEKTCNKLYKFLCEYEKKYPIPHHIQKWTAEMWAILWDYWKVGGLTEVHKELDFSWATDTMTDYNSKNIFHLAGVTSETCKDKFFKSKYISKNLLDEYLNDNTIFDNIVNTNATYGYTRVVIQCASRRINITTQTTQTIEKTIDLPIETNKSSISNRPSLHYFDRRRTLFERLNHSHMIQNTNEAEKHSTEVEKDSTEVEKQSTEVEKDSNEEEKQSTEEEKDSTDIFNIFNRFKSPFYLNRMNSKKQIKDKQITTDVETDNNILKKSLHKFIYISSVTTQVHKKVEETTKKIVTIEKLIIMGTHYCANTYVVDKDVMCCNKNIWRSVDNKLIIFFTGSTWTITFARCESEIGPSCGGIVSNLSSDIFVNKWNFDCFTNVIKEEVEI